MSSQPTPRHRAAAPAPTTSRAAAAPARPTSTTRRAGGPFARHLRSGPRAAVTGGVVAALLLGPPLGLTAATMTGAVGPEHVGPLGPVVAALPWHEADAQTWLDGRDPRDDRASRTLAHGRDEDALGPVDAPSPDAAPTPGDESPAPDDPTDPAADARDAAETPPAEDATDPEPSTEPADAPDDAAPSTAPAPERPAPRGRPDGRRGAAGHRGHGGERLHGPHGPRRPVPVGPRQGPGLPEPRRGERREGVPHRRGRRAGVDGLAGPPREHPQLRPAGDRRRARRRRVDAALRLGMTAQASSTGAPVARASRSSRLRLTARP